ncbi:MAG: dihydroneopterin aldolase [Stackebrandtia sp.]
MAEKPDQITLSGLRVHGHHGVYAAERATGQDFIIDVTLHLDTFDAAATDNVGDTVHYGELADALALTVSDSPRVNLLETLAQRLAAVCLHDKRVSACEVTVHKPQAPISHPFTDVSVTIFRSRT